MSRPEQPSSEVATDAYLLQEKQKERVEASDAQHGPPDGGLRAWSVVFGGFLTYFCTFGLLNSFGTFQVYYFEEILSTSTNSAIAWIGSLQIFLFFIGGMIFGPVFDTRGSKILFIPGTIIYVLSLMMTSLCAEYYQFILAQGILFGIGDSMLFYPTISSISHWFDKKRGYALGIVVAGSSLGGIAWPLILDKLFHTAGFPWACRISGFICLGMLIPASFLVVPRLPPRENEGLGPEAFKTMFTHKAYVLLIAAMFFVMWGMFLPFYYVPTYGLAHGMSFQMSNNLLSILNAGSLVGRIVTGILADKAGRFNTTFLCAVITAVLLWCLHIVESAPAIIVFAVLYGFFSGGLISLQSACVAQVTPNMSHFGAFNGVLMAICSFGVLTGAPIGGALIAKGFGGFIDFAGAILTFGAVLLLFARFAAEPVLAKVF